MAELFFLARGGRCNDNVGAGFASANIFGANVLDWSQLLPAFHKDAQSLLSKHLFSRLSSVFISLENVFSSDKLKSPKFICLPKVQIHGELVVKMNNHNLDQLFCPF